MADELDVDAMLNRFRERARAVRQRGMPPLEGAERKRFMDQARTDYMDYAIVGDATASLEDGILTLRVDLRPKGDGGSA
jgi:flagellar motor component MotA